MRECRPGNRRTVRYDMFTTMQGGDPDKAFAEADYTDKYYYQTQQMVHCALEPHGATAKYENGEWTIWTTTQGAYVSRYWIACRWWNRSSSARSGRYGNL